MATFFWAKTRLSPFCPRTTKNFPEKSRSSAITIHGSLDFIAASDCAEKGMMPIGILSGLVAYDSKWTFSPKHADTNNAATARMHGYDFFKTLTWANNLLSKAFAPLFFIMQRVGKVQLVIGEPDR